MHNGPDPCSAHLRGTWGEENPNPAWSRARRKALRSEASFITAVVIGDPGQEPHVKADEVELRVGDVFGSLLPSQRASW